jgi:AcrR family transcriptional regulator
MQPITEREQKKEEQRQRILDAAIRAFVRKGYHNTTMDDIVKESGLSKGTLYWYFETKKQLFMALFERDLELGKNEIIAETRKHSNFIAQMRALLDTYLVLNEPYDEAHEATSRRILAEFWQQAVIDPDIREIYIKNYYDFWTEFASQLLQEAKKRGEVADDVDIPALLAIIIAVFDGLMLQWMVNYSPVSFERIFSTFLLVLEKSLRK